MFKKGYKQTKEHKERISKSLKGRVKTSEHNLKNSFAHKGNKHPNWKGGITPLNKRLRESAEYKLWRKAVYERDGYKCIWCGDDSGGNLEADHIKQFAYYPELRFAIDNGRTLCKPCHKTTETYGRRENLPSNATPT